MLFHKLQAGKLLNTLSHKQKATESPHPHGLICEGVSGQFEEGLISHTDVRCGSQRISGPECGLSVYSHLAEIRSDHNRNDGLTLKAIVEIYLEIYVTVVVGLCLNEWYLRSFLSQRSVVLL